MKQKIYSLTTITIFVAGILFWVSFNGAMDATNTMEFCISCHDMKNTVYQEYQHSIHYKNSSGVQATCPDCHVPREWGPKLIRKIQASVEVYHWLAGSIDTAEKFEAKRAVLAEKVWKVLKDTDSRECRNCHQFDRMELEQQGLFAQKKHLTATQEGKTCIDCHKGISHKLPEPESVTKSAKQKQIDLEYGGEINETCAGCHGEFGEGKPDGEYPRLAGLSSHYIAKQLRDFKSKKRLNIPMIPYTDERELPEEDLLAIAAYLEQINLPTKLAPIEAKQDFNAFERLQQSNLIVNISRLNGDITAGKASYNKECAGCHAKNGYGNSAKLIPQLTGQHSEYLRRQINRFRNSERLHDDDQRDQLIFQKISDTQIQNILSYLAILDDH